MDLIDRADVHDLIAKRLSDYLTDESREELEELDIKVEEDLPTVQAVPILENTTNGEIILSLFPTAETQSDEDECCMKVHFPGAFNIECFDLVWWNDKRKSLNIGTKNS